MSDNFIYILTGVYGISGLATLLGFAPTIKDLWNKKPSANSGTYLIWAVTAFVASLYGFFVLQNLMFNIIINLQLAGCIAVLILRYRLKCITVCKIRKR